MKIGAFIPQGWRMDLNGIDKNDQWQTILDAANKIEALNYESIWVYDHFHTVPKPTQDPTFECWTLMSALSQTTEKVRLGQMCTCNSYRNPSYLTKVASNIDVMSGGDWNMQLEQVGMITSTRHMDMIILQLVSD